MENKKERTHEQWPLQEQTAPDNAETFYHGGQQAHPAQHQTVQHPLDVLNTPFQPDPTWLETEQNYWNSLQGFHPNDRATVPTYNANTTAAAMPTQGDTLSPWDQSSRHKDVEEAITNLRKSRMAREKRVPVRSPAEGSLVPVPRRRWASTAPGSSVRHRNSVRARQSRRNPAVSANVSDSQLMPPPPRPSPVVKDEEPDALSENGLEIESMNGVENAGQPAASHRLLATGATTSPQSVHQNDKGSISSITIKHEQSPLNAAASGSITGTSGQANTASNDAGQSVPLDPRFSSHASYTWMWMRAPPKDRNESSASPGSTPGAVNAPRKDSRRKPGSGTLRPETPQMRRIIEKLNSRRKTTSQKVERPATPDTPSYEVLQVENTSVVLKPAAKAKVLDGGTSSKACTPAFVPTASTPDAAPVVSAAAFTSQAVPTVPTTAHRVRSQIPQGDEAFFSIERLKELITNQTVKERASNNTGTLNAEDERSSPVTGGFQDELSKEDQVQQLPQTKYKRKPTKKTRYSSAILKKKSAYPKKETQADGRGRFIAPPFTTSSNAHTVSYYMKRENGGRPRKPTEGESAEVIATRRANMENKRASRDRDTALQDRDKARALMLDHLKASGPENFRDWLYSTAPAEENTDERVPAEHPGCYVDLKHVPAMKLAGVATGQYSSNFDGSAVPLNSVLHPSGQFIFGGYLSVSYCPYESPWTNNGKGSS